MTHSRYSLAGLCLLMFTACAAPAPTGPAPGTLPSSAPASSAPSAPAVEASAKPATALSGRVYDDVAEPVAGATVTATREGQAPVTVTSSADGTFRLALDTGTYVVVASHPGWTERRQTVVVGGETRCDFGGTTSEGANPYFLSSFPEVSGVTFDEQAPGGPLTVTVRLSEPLSAESRTSFVSRLELLAGTTPFLNIQGGAEPELETQATWDVTGQVLTIRYAHPYVASGAATVTYSLKLRQRLTDPAIADSWETLGIKDAEGNEMGRNRADFAFVKQDLFIISYLQLNSETWGKNALDRRWNLTHGPQQTFTAARDTTGPGLTAASARTEVAVGTKTVDVLELRFTEPMRAAKTREDFRFTYLQHDRDIIRLRVSARTDGSQPRDLGAIQPSAVRFSSTDTSVVFLDLPAGTFKDQKWVEITLGPDARDPAGNAPDAAKAVVTATVI